MSWSSVGYVIPMLNCSFLCSSPSLSIWVPANILLSMNGSHQHRRENGRRMPGWWRAFPGKKGQIGILGFLEWCGQKFCPAREQILLDSVHAAPQFSSYFQIWYVTVVYLWVKVLASFFLALRSLSAFFCSTAKNNLFYQVWDETLAKSAEAWAATCIWDHGPSYLLRFLGQNLSVRTGR